MKTEPTTSRWSREWMAYCKAQGREPAAQLAFDREAFPGGCMCGFILWMSVKLAAFKAAHPEAVVGGWIVDHEAKIRFLNQ